MSLVAPPNCPPFHYADPFLVEQRQDLRCKRFDKRAGLRCKNLEKWDGLRCKSFEKRNGFSSGKLETPFKFLTHPEKGVSKGCLKKGVSSGWGGCLKILFD